MLTGCCLFVSASLGWPSHSLPPLAVVPLEKPGRVSLDLVVAAFAVPCDTAWVLEASLNWKLALGAEQRLVRGFGLVFLGIW